MDKCLARYSKQDFDINVNKSVTFGHFRSQNPLGELKMRVGGGESVRLAAGIRSGGRFVVLGSWLLVKAVC